MSSASKHSDLPRAGAASLRASIVPPVQFLGFWTAVVVPFVLLGLVVTGAALQQPLVSSALLTANVVGLLLGRSYRQ